MQEKIESFGYKLWKTDKEFIGYSPFITKHYQKRVDVKEGWEEAPLCQTNDKLFLNITETFFTLNGMESHSFSIDLCHEGVSGKWCTLKIQGLKEEDLENMLTFEDKIRKMWVAFN